MGSWRAALQSLRSTIDNVLFCLFYKDHPVELRLWGQGKDKRSFSELFGYLKKHPEMNGLPQSVVGVFDLEREYFLSLCGEQKTQERIWSFLQTGKPLRN